MNESYIKNVIEAALLAAGRPLQIVELTQLFEESDVPEAAAIRGALDSLEADYVGRGIEVKETATGYRIQVRRDLANEISRLWPERPPRYSRALLETLALIAYRQPITRAEIEAVRGVAVNPNIIKTVLERNWVRVVGVRDVPGRPELLGTTREFLDYFGLRGLEDLPPLAELKAMGDINLQLDLAKPGVAQLEDQSAGGEGVAVGAVGAVALLGVEAGESDSASDELVGEELAAGSAGVETENADGGDVSANVDDAGSDADASITTESDEPVASESDAGEEGGEGSPEDAEHLLTEAHAETNTEERAEATDTAEDTAAHDPDPLDDVDFDDAPGQDDDSDEDELSASDPKTSSELVAASRDVDD